MQELLRTLWDLVLLLVKLTGEALGLILVFSLLLTWVAWWLLGVNWRKAWPVLAQGAWVPFVLLGTLGALVWSQIAPSNAYLIGFLTVPNFWWQFGAVGLLMASALFMGWLQGVFGWTPPEISVEPPTDHGHGHTHRHDHDHGHGHAHQAAPAAAHGHH